MRKIKQIIQGVKEDVDGELHKEYVDVRQYNREKQTMKDDIKVLYQYKNKQ